MKVAILMYAHTCTRKNMQHLHISCEKLEWTDDTGVFNEHYNPASYLKVGLSIHSFLMTLLITSRLMTVRLEPEWKG